MCIKSSASPENQEREIRGVILRPRPHTLEASTSKGLSLVVRYMAIWSAVQDSLVLDQVTINQSQPHVFLWHSLRSELCTSFHWDRFVCTVMLVSTRESSSITLLLLGSLWGTCCYTTSKGIPPQRDKIFSWQKPWLLCMKDIRFLYFKLHL